MLDVLESPDFKVNIDLNVLLLEKTHYYYYYEIYSRISFSSSFYSYILCTNFSNLILSNFFNSEWRHNTTVFPTPQPALPSSSSSSPPPPRPLDDRNGGTGNGGVARVLLDVVPVCPRSDKLIPCGGRRAPARIYGYSSR